MKLALVSANCICSGVRSFSFCRQLIGHIYPRIEPGGRVRRFSLKLATRTYRLSLDIKLSLIPHRFRSSQWVLRYPSTNPSDSFCEKGFLRSTLIKCSGSSITSFAFRIGIVPLGAFLSVRRVRLDVFVGIGITLFTSTLMLREFPSRSSRLSERSS